MVRLSDRAGVQFDHPVGAVHAEAQVEAVVEGLVGRRRQQGKQEASLVAQEVPSFGLESRLEAEVTLVEVPARPGVADRQVEVVEVRQERALTMTTCGPIPGTSNSSLTTSNLARR